MRGTQVVVYITWSRTMGFILIDLIEIFFSVFNPNSNWIKCELKQSNGMENKAMYRVQMCILSFKIEVGLQLGKIERGEINQTMQTNERTKCNIMLQSICRNVSDWSWKRSEKKMCFTLSFSYIKIHQCLFFLFWADGLIHRVYFVLCCLSST